MSPSIYLFHEQVNVTPWMHAVTKTIETLINQSIITLTRQSRRIFPPIHCHVKLLCNCPTNIESTSSYQFIQKRPVSELVTFSIQNFITVTPLPSASADGCQFPCANLVVIALQNKLSKNSTQWAVTTKARVRQSGHTHVQSLTVISRFPRCSGWPATWGTSISSNGRRGFRGRGTWNHSHWTN